MRSASDSPDSAEPASVDSTGTSQRRAGRRSATSLGEACFLPGTLALTVVGCALLTLACGQIGTALALRARPGPLLRNE